MTSVGGASAGIVRISITWLCAESFPELAMNASQKQEIAGLVALQEPVLTLAGSEDNVVVLAAKV